MGDEPAGYGLVVLPWRLGNPGGSLEKIGCASAGTAAAAAVVAARPITVMARRRQRRKALVPLFIIPQPPVVLF
ncbi:MAG TPA: hypothetical protein VGO16_10915 [Pseudonocardiaceae bacterium]|nr:hypothetical protein [Pseudonocardiaceae bacterium]